MKQIQVKKYNIPLTKGGKTATTIELIDLALKQPPKGGFDRGELREIARVRKAVDSIKDGIFEIEDSDFDTLLDYVLNSKWVVADLDILTWMDDIEAYKDDKKSRK